MLEAVAVASGEAVGEVLGARFHAAHLWSRENALRQQRSLTRSQGAHLFPEDVLDLPIGRGSGQANSGVEAVEPPVDHASGQERLADIVTRTHEDLVRRLDQKAGDLFLGGR